MDDDSVGVALVLASAVGFGTLGVLGKLAADAGLSIPTVLAFRFALATVILWPLLWFRGRFQLLTGRTLAVAAGLGGLGYATMSGLYFLGLEYMTAGLAAIVLYTYPAIVVCFVAVANPTRVTKTVLVALALSIGGVALITGADPAGVDPRGVAVVLGAALAYATYIVTSQRALTLTAFVLPAAAVSFFGFGLGTNTLTVPAGPTAWSVVVALAVLATVVPVLAFFAGLSRIGASRASIVSTAEPAVTVGLGAVVLGEPISTVTVVGGALVVTGVVLVQRDGS
ncbi:DMT family transporter [Natribaculum luteum]|uniref:DMT family transporter n=1 Tax=Natribaculum luteum TaxID=1586232 RepID=A0ABD5NXJ4_9EURY|nr:DMT family transporter [Natribaculum luteum]